MILEIIQYTLPVLIVSIVFYLLVYSFLRSERQRRTIEMNLENNRMIIPLRLQAYERIILFLERIIPDTMLLRIDQSEMTCTQLQSELLRTIRSEYEHNVSQQLYISHEAWEKVKLARDQTIQLINMSTEGTRSNMPSIALSRNIIENQVTAPVPSMQAIEFLKKEASELF